MDKKDFISVVIPFYYAEKTIERCLNSIVNQTYSNLEILLVDDGSKDQSIEICEKFARQDSRIRILRQENQGVGMARNYGLCEARGEYISFVDSDDWLDREYYEKAVENGLFIKKPDIVWMGHIDGIAKDVYQVFRIPENKVVDIEQSDEICKDHFVRYLWNKLYRTDVIQDKKITFTNQYNYGEDSIFVLHYLKQASTCMMIGDVYYHYSFSGGEKVDSLSTKTYKKDFNRFALDLMESLHQGVESCGVRKCYIDTGYVGWVFFEAINNLNKNPETYKNRKERICQYQEIHRAFHGYWEEITINRRKYKLIRQLLQKKQYLLLDFYYRTDKKISVKIQKYLL